MTRHGAPGGPPEGMRMRHNADISGHEFSHTPVLWREIREFVRTTPGGERGILVDCTLGEGGHSELILGEFAGVRVMGFDRDEEVLEVAKKRLLPFEGRVEFINDNFSALAAHCGGLRGSILWFLYDLGISSYHFEKSGRGFSFRGDEPLDMRLERGLKTDARRVVNTYPENELTDIFHGYGEERWAKKIARRICQYREQKPLETSAELAELVLRAIPKRFQVKNIHPATRVFQALRIAVNDELSAIERSLRDAADILAEGGRIMAMSYHSLEDRIVKNTFRRMERGCTCGLEPASCRCRGKAIVRVITKKPLTPAEDERAANRRARSAKLRVCERCAL